MGFLSNIAGRLFGKAFEAPEATVDLTDVLEFVRRSQPGGKGDRALLAAYHATPPLHTPVRTIAQSVASLDITATRDGEPVDDHPMLKLLATPNPVMTGWQRRYIQAQYMEVLGEALDVLLPADNEVGVEMYPIPKTAATRKKTRSGIVWEVRLNDARFTVPDELMLVDKHHDLTDLYGRGVGLGRVLADEIEIIEYSAEFEKAEFYNHAKPSVVIHLPGASEKAVDQFKEEYMQAFGGVDKHGLPLVGTGRGDMDIQELGRSLKDSEVLKHRKYSAELVGQTFGIPPLMLGRTENANRATAFIERKVYADNCVNPRADRECDHYEANLLPKFADTDITLHHEDASPEDTEQRREAMEARPETVTVNEWRDLQGLPPLEGGDVFLRNTNQVQEVPAGSVEGEAGPARVRAPVDHGGIIVRFPVERTKQQQQRTPSEAVRIAEAIEADRIDYQTSEAREFYEDSVREWAEAEAATLGVTPNFTLLNPKIVDFAREQTGEMIDQIDGTTKADLTDTVSRALKEGKSPREIRKEVQGLFDGASRHRAESIARTEMAKAQGHGQWSVQKVSGLVPNREWVATFDASTRMAHASLHGTRVGIDEDFTNPETGGTAKYPGDFPSAAQSINCRCTTVPWIDDESPALPEFPPDVLDEISGKAVVRAFADMSGRPLRDEAARYLVWKAADERRERQESEFAKEMRRRFDAQMKAALAVADTVFGLEASA